ncbi:sodium-dependent bicarbonate transport family permease [Marinimicrobium sp. ABcell2]|uniref:sodium-dependent bicarbonate transport family permease n=1 Tax=Marinimicrobium sp. ABcell2 TaxID=3069751 RepID=UPI0027B637D9|nr:sodium-dependent bicarbonate transport family permease [Marinimicrobium sp. ABcell2]MDQ2077813.1 sodium-dependent bicarbonate transport family permease [Marinimicrobium sp. ABcell2]
MPDIVIAFFALGLVAGLLKSDLKVPHAVYETLSILLMLTLGLKGGLALHGQAQGSALWDLLLIGSLGLIIPVVLFPLLTRLVRLDNANAVSIAAHYGSVSAGTFAVALALAQSAGMELAPETTLYLVLLEVPALVIMLWWYQRQKGAGSTSAKVWHEALTSRSVLLLVGGVIIGWIYGPEGLAPITPTLMGGFTTFLALFLLEMGICTARACFPLPLQHWRLLLFASLAPFALAWVGLGVGLWLGLPPGSLLVLAALTASASYIAAPAAIRAAVPEADIGLAMLAALGVTFPINVLIGIPLYQQWVVLLTQ